MTRTNEVDQSFSPIMSYKPKVQASGDNMPYMPNIDNQPCADNNIEVTNNVKNGEGKRYKTEVVGNPDHYKPEVVDKPQAKNTNGVNQDFGADMSYSPNSKETRRMDRVSESTTSFRPIMSYKPKVSSTPRAINTNGVNQAFGADMCYSPDIAENTKLTRADMSYIPNIVNMPQFRDK